MKPKLLIASAALIVIAAASQAYADPESCKKVRLSDLGWTDLSLTNATASVILESLGYEAEETLLSLPITFQSLEAGDIDVFLGNWLPVQDDEFKSFVDKGAVEVVTTNLTGAKFTLAVPTYVSDAGVKSYGDLAKFADKFQSSIYGIEPGSNKPLVDMVDAGRHGLAGWQIVETSEAAMLSQVERLGRSKDWIVFLAWAPHPMNIKFDLTYLDGGDIEYGPNFGGATVRTVARKGYVQACPNVGKLLANLKFNIDYENRGMDAIQTNGENPKDVARKLIMAEPKLLDQWLSGVKTYDDQDGLAAAQAALIGK
jgi:glycine betaine/proline transport system substrate-binding protein